MKDLVIQPTSKAQIDNFIASPAHGLLIIGPSGAGKKSVAVIIAEVLLGIDDFSSYPYGLNIAAEKDKSSISIEAIRQLEQFLTLKVISTKTPNRLIIIEDADQMTREAQNAVLKTLEEPPEGTVLIFTASNEHSLLPTVRSRLRSITLNRPTKEAIEANLSDLYDSADIDRAYSISNGRVGLMKAILEDDEHPLLQATDVARQLLGKSLYERLNMVDELSKQRALARDVIFILEQMAHLGLSSTNAQNSRKWQKVLGASTASEEALLNSGQIKLVLVNLVMSL